MKYGIAIFPSKKLQDLVNSYRKRYDPHYALISPHVTLKPAFTLEEEDVEAFVEQVRKISEGIGTIQLEVNKVKSFQPVNNVIYLKVEDDPNLTKLYEKLQDIGNNSENDYPFIPHITIGQQLSVVEHSDIIGVLKMMDIQHSETIDRFQLLYQLDNKSWTVYETFHLRKENN